MIAGVFAIVVRPDDLVVRKVSAAVVPAGEADSVLPRWPFRRILGVGSKID
jgi:hypothetical protein